MTTTAPTAVPGGVDRDARRATVRATTTPALDGIDRIEVLSNHTGTPGSVPGAPQQRTLLVHLLRGPVPGHVDSMVDREAVVVLGGVRNDPAVNPVRVEWAHAADRVAGGVEADGTPVPADPGLPTVSAADRELVARSCSVEDRATTLVVRTSSSGDWSTYVLVLRGPGGVGTPSGFDVPLSSEPFTFTVDCPHDLDCCSPATCPPVPATSPLTDYLARDYEALRTRLLDRIATLVPDWTDRSPADPLVALAELFAYAGDRLTYMQDAIAVESYLGTARRRTSVHRHARLLDYRAHHGCAARTWLAFTTDIDTTLAAGAAVATAVRAGALPGDATARDAVEQGAVVFETREPLDLRTVRNAVVLHAWGNPDACLPAGTTSAYLRHPPGEDPGLRSGDVLVLAPLGPEPGAGIGSREQPRRHAVRLVEDPVATPDPLAGGDVVVRVRWAGADALTVPLPVARRGGTGAAETAAVALANVALAEHAATLPPAPLEPSQVPLSGEWRPRLPVAGIAWADPHVDRSSATAGTRPEATNARVQVVLDDGARTWTAVPDLLASGRLDPHVVAETEPSGAVRLRFGNGLTGRRPSGGTEPLAYLRVGGGTTGNVGADTLTTLLHLPERTSPTADPGALVTVTNPCPAGGGVAPQSLAEIRELAPYAFRSQLRAVTAADHAATASARPGVQRAVSRRRWTGSWFTHETALDPVASRADDPSVATDVLDVLDVRRMAGTDVALGPPVHVPLLVVIGVCVAEGHLRANVAAAVTRVLSTQRLADGTLGFFHPDRFTFGQPLLLSDLVATVMAVPGVRWVDVDDTPQPDGLRFRRLGRHPAGEVAAGRIPAGPREVLRVDNDPSNPDLGRLGLKLRGGL